ncbi:MAG: trypsin-like peptidase domain-containing protein [Anaerolineae bacterium]|nr:trypsin-like peptidase domain-containing protein [Anaerolineae bacterium]
MKRLFRFWSILVVLALLVGAVGLTPASALDRKTRQDIMKAVVSLGPVLEVTRDGRTETRVVQWGSGTILTPDGLILTNYHVQDTSDLVDILPPEVELVEGIMAVFMTTRSDQPPTPVFFAETASADRGLDLAVLRITMNIDGSRVDPDDLDLPYVPMGDSDELEIGDTLNIFGYPAIGGETITFTSGNVSGFTSEAGIKGRAWIKTDATISGGNSGGTAVDENGLLVGVPTQAAVTEQVVDCRPIVDSNGDGRIDENDPCIPIGGFLNALRPVNLAKPLVQAALSGVGYEDEGKREEEEYTGQAEFTRLFFSPGVNEANLPTSVIYSAPSGTRSLYLFFDYSGMVKGVTYEMKTYIDGVEEPDWSLAPTPWDGYNEGMWWIGWDDASFEDADYDFELYVEEELMASASITIGGRPSREPTFSNIVFSDGTSEGYVFSEGVEKITAYFDFDNMGREEWQYVWYQDGEEIISDTDTWNESSSGQTNVWLSSRRGFGQGHYRLELYIEDQLAATSDFWVLSEGGTTTGASFSEIIFAEGVDRRGNPVKPDIAFPSGLPELHVLSEYEGMEDGLPFREVWYINDEQVLDTDVEWEWGEEGTFHDYIYSSRGVLPDGEYKIELYVENHLLQEGSCTIGEGENPPPPPPPPPGDEITLYGTVLDADTQRGIRGALFVVLKPGISLDEFQYTEDEVEAYAETDRNGEFELDPLPADGVYSMLVLAEGYWPAGGDDIPVQALDLPLVIELEAQ